MWCIFFEVLFSSKEKIELEIFIAGIGRIEYYSFKWNIWYLRWYLDRSCVGVWVCVFVNICGCVCKFCMCVSMCLYINEVMWVLCECVRLGDWLCMNLYVWGRVVIVCKIVCECVVV